MTEKKRIRKTKKKIEEPDEAEETIDDPPPINLATSLPPEPPAPEGIRCPDCGCNDIDTWSTRRAFGKIRRVRECRYCGKRFPTFEKLAVEG